MEQQGSQPDSMPQHLKYTCPKMKTAGKYPFVTNSDNDVVCSGNDILVAVMCLLRHVTPLLKSLSTYCMNDVTDESDLGFST